MWHNMEQNNMRNERPRVEVRMFYYRLKLRAKQGALGLVWSPLPHIKGIKGERMET